MRTLTRAAGSKEALSLALSILRGGGLVAFPTDTVYGLGSLAFDGSAVRAIYRAKRRPVEKAVPVLVGNIAELPEVAAEVPEMARLLAEQFWPGPLTVVVRKATNLPNEVASGATVGVREPDHPVALALLREAGPMAVTSANMSGQPSPRSAADVLAQLDGLIDLVLDGGPCPGGVPSTVVDCTGSEPVILRRGPISIEQVKGVVRKLTKPSPNVG